MTIRLPKPGIPIESVLYFSFFLFFLVATNRDFQMSPLLWWGSILFVYVIYLYSNHWKITIPVHGFVLWWGIFVLFCALSAVAALRAELVINQLKTLLVLLAIAVPLQNTPRNLPGVQKLIIIYVAAITLNLVYLFCTVDMVNFQLAQHGLGDHGSWNGNDVGIKAANNVIFALYMIVSRKNNLIIRAGMYLSIAVSLNAIFWTASRKAFLILILGVSGFIVLKKPEKLMRNILLAVVILAVSFVALMEIPVLYQTIGWRMEGLAALLTGRGQIDSSTLLRKRYIEVGLEAFQKSPIWGYGIDNFRVINASATMHETYSHNNFIEILVGLGLIGFIAYYSYYIQLIVRYFRAAICRQIPLLVHVLFLVFIISLGMQMAMVSYYEIGQFMTLLWLDLALELECKLQKDKN